MPRAMRAASGQILRAIERYDFDLGGPLYATSRSAPSIAATSSPITLTRHSPLPPRGSRSARSSRPAPCPSFSAAIMAFPIPVFRALEEPGADHPYPCRSAP